jgi:universal stress protein A
MIKIQGVMVPVDFSKESILAVKFAASMAEEYKTRLYVLHVMDPIHPSVRNHMANFEAFEKNRALEVKADLENAIPGSVKERIPVETILETGNPMHAIVDKAKELGVDVLVIATHGRSGLAHVLLGSVAENVIRHAPCPVFVIRNPRDKFVYGWE